MYKDTNIITATFTSVWDGCLRVSSPCKVNMDTREVIDIEPVDITGVDNLDYECVTLDGKECNVVLVDHEEEVDDGEYWRK